MTSALMTLVQAGDGGRCRMAVVDRAILERMSDILPAQTEKCVMRTSGISVNIWVKSRDGQPIRPSIADRLIERIQTKWNDTHA